MGESRKREGKESEEEVREEDEKFFQSPPMKIL